jgi:hypothetical protein
MSNDKVPIVIRQGIAKQVVTIIDGKYPDLEIK